MHNLNHLFSCLIINFYSKWQLLWAYLEDIVTLELLNGDIARKMHFVIQRKCLFS